MAGNELRKLRRAVTGDRKHGLKPWPDTKPIPNAYGLGYFLSPQPGLTPASFIRSGAQGTLKRLAVLARTSGVTTPMSRARVNLPQAATRAAPLY